MFEISQEYKLQLGREVKKYCKNFVSNQNNIWFYEKVCNFLFLFYIFTYLFFLFFLSVSFYIRNDMDC